MPTRVIAIDWSGAAARSEQKIWLADIDLVRGEVARLEAGRSRSFGCETQSGRNSDPGWIESPRQRLRGR